MRNMLLFITIILLLGGCSQPTQSSSLNRVGLLLEDTIDDQGWNNKGYQGLLKIQSNFDIDVFFEEGIDEFTKAEEAIKKFDKKDVNLIFGHGRIFADFFSNIQDEYPHIHFVSFNGQVSGDNITSLHFESHAMGFFGGMVAAEMSAKNKVGVIAAYSWQPEIQGFIKGATYQNKDVHIYVDYVNDWSNIDKAYDIYTKMRQEGVDVFYPAGDGFHVPIVEEIKKEGVYAIGFVSDQSDLGDSTILTSTVQHVDSLYQLVVERFNEGNLETGNLFYDFGDGVISLGEFSSIVPNDFQQKIDELIKQYIETGELPK